MGNVQRFDAYPRIPRAATDPAGMVSDDQGATYWNTVTKALRVWDGSAWVQEPASGSWKFYDGATLPLGYLWRDGTIYLNTDHPFLQTAIAPSSASPYYVDSTHFKVPDGRLVVPFGAKAESVPVIAAKATTGGSISTRGGAVTAPAPLNATVPASSPGDLLVMCVTATLATGTAALATPSGWRSITTAPSASAIQISWFYRWAGPAESTTVPVAFDTTQAAQGVEVAVYRITGADPTTPFNVSSVTAVQAGGATYVVSGVTTTRDNSLVLFGVGTSSTAVITFTDTLTEETDAGNDPGQAASLSIASKTQATAGASGSCTFTPSLAPAYYLGAAIAIAPLQSALGHSGGSNLHAPPDHDHNGWTGGSPDQPQQTAGGAAVPQRNIHYHSLAIDSSPSEPNMMPYLASNTIIKT